jgi:hypothetical protein
MPRVLRFAVRRPALGAPRPGERLAFICSLHEEGTGLSWEYPIRLSSAREGELIEASAALAKEARAPAGGSRAGRLGERIGRALHRSFLGERGAEYLRRMDPTAVLLEVDETILNLPWELMHGDDGALAQSVPVGRVVGTRSVPQPERDPLQQDRAVRILAVADPTADLALARAELEALRSVAESATGSFTVEVDALEGDHATLARFRRRLADGDYDILHFAGHAAFLAARPGESVLRFADGVMTADEVLGLPWPAPPGLVFASACESAQTRRGARLAGRRRNANGLAAAFLSAGVAGYLGYLWPVSDEGAGVVAGSFYSTLFERENVGLAVLEARRTAVGQLAGDGDLSGYSLVLYGDAASEHRRDLATAA